MAGPDRRSHPRPRLSGRASAGLVAGLLIGIGALAWVAQGPNEPEARDVEEWAGAPLKIRDETRPKLGVIANLKLMGDEIAPSDDQLCDDERIGRMAEQIAGVVEDGVLIDERSWNELAWGGRAGLASFWSKCLHGGAAVHVRAEHDGAVLAVYDPAEGLTSY